jgi:predicted permease
MDIFFLLLGKILPLYALIAAGYLAGQKLKIQKESIASLVIYILVPVIFFGATAQMPFEKENLMIPVFLFILSTIIGLGLYHVSRFFWKDKRRNLLGYMMGTANTGYFGIPVFIALFGPENLGTYVFATVGMALYEGTFGYYLMARGEHSVRDSFMRLLRLPLLPAAFLGLLFSASGAHLPDVAIDFYNTVKGAYTVLGMMIIGLSLSTLKHMKSDLKFTGFILAGKFLVWPAVTIGFLWALNFIMPVTDLTYSILVLIAVVPLAANGAAFATHLKVEPDKAATTILISTIVALVYIPLVMAALFF